MWVPLDMKVGGEGNCDEDKCEDECEEECEDEGDECELMWACNVSLFKLPNPHK